MSWTLTLQDHAYRLSAKTLSQLTGLQTLGDLHEMKQAFMRFSLSLAPEMSLEEAWEAFESSMQKD